MDFDDLLEDHATERVPDSRTVSGLRVGLLYSAQAFGIPGLVGGVEIGSALGLTAATGSFIAGGVFLAVLGSITAIIGVKARLTSYMLTQFAFGRTGSKVVNLAFALSQFGWFGVQVGLLSILHLRFPNSVGSASRLACSVGRPGVLARINLAFNLAKPPTSSRVDSSWYLPQCSVSDC